MECHLRHPPYFASEFHSTYLYSFYDQRRAVTDPPKFHEVMALVYQPPREDIKGCIHIWKSRAIGGVKDDKGRDDWCLDVDIYDI